MNTGLLGDLIELMNQSNAGYITFELDNVTIIVADKENADVMIHAVEVVDDRP